MDEGRNYEITDDGTRMHINFKSKAEEKAERLKIIKERIFKKLPKKRGHVSKQYGPPKLNESTASPLVDNLVNPTQQETVIKTVKLNVQK